MTIKPIQPQANISCRDRMNHKYSLCSIFIVALTLWVFFYYWPTESSGMTRNGWKESSMTKYHFFLSVLKQSGESRELCYSSKCSMVEMDRVTQILALNLSEGEIAISNQEAKMMFYKTLAHPLQSVCQ